MWYHHLAVVNVEGKEEEVEVTAEGDGVFAVDADEVLISQVDTSWKG